MKLSNDEQSPDVDSKSATSTGAAAASKKIPDVKMYTFFLCDHCLGDRPIKTSDEYKIQLPKIENRSYSLKIPVHCVSASGRFDISEMRFIISEIEEAAEPKAEETSFEPPYYKSAHYSLNIPKKLTMAKTLIYQSKKFEDETLDTFVDSLFDKQPKWELLRVHLNHTILKNTQFVLNNINWQTLPLTTFIVYISNLYKLVLLDFSLCRETYQEFLCEEFTSESEDMDKKLRKFCSYVTLLSRCFSNFDRNELDNFYSYLKLCIFLVYGDNEVLRLFRTFQNKLIEDTSSYFVRNISDFYEVFDTINADNLFKLFTGLNVYDPCDVLEDYILDSRFPEEDLTITSN
ncbi:uncharacterized protein LOC111631932 isoform X2 [Centruroides sculpturatus]|uniref:uncharacterized protein LOC111631932 isoform X2 n=1 Tax=Centruroides sculpturatus TaxID=218467 RepID=UPI000C6C9D7E|nr:uncharacterized protein LOC111631932 isoform X2 [Centruroides sculpturatus]